MRLISTGVSLGMWRLWMRIRLESRVGSLLSLLYYSSCASIHMFIIACVSCKRDGGGVVLGMWQLIP